MPLPQPDRNVELVEIVTEGFKLITNTLVALCEYVEESKYEHRDFFPINDELDKLKEFVNG